MAHQLFQLPKQIPLGAGRVYAGAKATFYLTGTTTKTDTYTSSALSTPNANPVVADSEGVFAPIYLNPTITYKLTLTTSADVLIYTVDPVNDVVLSQAIIGGYLYTITAAETSASVTPVNYAYPPGNLLRYGTNTTPGTTDMTDAIQAALDQHAQGGAAVYAPAGTYLTGQIDWPANNLTLRGEASGFAYNTSAATRTIFKAKAATTIVFDLVQTGVAEDRTGNHLSDFKIDGNSIAQYGIDCAGTNIIERVHVVGCTTAGVHLGNFTNSTHIVRCGLNSNSGWGLQAEGASTTTFSVEETNTSLNTLGGIDLQAGVLVQFSKCVSESNSGPGLRIYRPNAHTNAMLGYVFDTCWFEDNGSTAPSFTIVIDAETRNEANAPSRILFRNCRINPSTATRKHMDVSCSKWVTFENCQFDASTASDTLTLSGTSYFVAWIECANAPGFTGLSATQIDNAIAQGSRCYSSDRDIKRTVNAGSPAAAFTNSWVNYDGGFATAKYWFDREGNVCLEGAVKTGTPPNSIFTLPVGYRPAAQQGFAVDANGAHGLVYVNTSGTVVPNVGSTLITNLSGIKFATG